MRARGTCNLILIATFWSKIYFLKFAYSALYKLLYVRYGTGIRGVKEITSTFRPTHTHTHICVCPTQKSIWQMENKSTWFRLNGSALWLLPKCIFGMWTNNIYNQKHTSISSLSAAHMQRFIIYIYGKSYQ